MSHFSRRALLRGLAGTAAGAAFVPIMSRLTRAQAMPTRRFVFVVEGNCFEPITLLTSGARAALAGPGVLSRTLDPVNDRWWYDAYRHTSPLEVHETDFSSAPALGAIHAQGLDAQTLVLFGLSSKITGGGHSAQHGVLSSSRTLGSSPSGITIDALLGGLSTVRGNTPYDVVRLGVNGDPTRRIDIGTCAAGAGHPLALILQPSAAFSVLFGSVGSPADQAAIAGRQSLMQFGIDDVHTALATFHGNADAQAKLQSYADSLTTVMQRQQQVTMLHDRLAAARPTLPATNPYYVNDVAHPDVFNRFDAQLELATAALKGGLTNVVVVGSGTGGLFDMLYPSATPTNDVMRHPLHHGSATTPAYLQTIHNATAFQVGAIARMARALKDTPDGSGTMLDSTVIVYIGDNGEQHHSTASEFPVLVLGGGALGLRTGGRTLIYPGLGNQSMAPPPVHRQVSNLWNTLTYAAGHPIDTFGAEGAGRVHAGPLTELS